MLFLSLFISPRSGSRRRFIRICLLFVLFGLVACSPVIVQAPVEKMTRDEMLAQLEYSIGRFHSIRGLAKSSYTLNGRKKSVTQVVLVRYPDNIRLEALGLFGSPALLAATDGNKTTVLLPGEGRALVGPAGTGFLQRILGLPMMTEGIVDIILMRPSIIQWVNAEAVSTDDRSSRLALSIGAASQEIDFDQDRNITRVRYLFDSTVQSELTYGRYENGFPGEIVFEIPARKIIAGLDFSEVELNVKHKEGIFQITPPDGYTIEPIPTVIQ